MTQVQKNIIANYLGSGLTALMGLLFVPLYIKFMGIESFGLVGFFVSLQSLLTLLDMGLSITLNRELARMSATADEAQETGNLVRTLEVIYWPVGMVICVVVALMSSFIAHQWINPSALSSQTVQTAVMLMGVAIALRWPFSLYSGGLLGLQKQVLLNWIQGLGATLRSGGVVLVLWLFSPTIEAFFFWQIIISGLETYLAARYLWHSLPARSQTSRFQRQLLGRVWRFSAGMTGISATVVLLVETDKIVLSRMLSLESFGYYVLAWTLAGGLFLAVKPMYLAMFPRFSELCFRQDTQTLTDLYHKSCQIVSVVLLPLAAVISFFSYDVLVIWTGNPIVSGNSFLILAFLVTGTALNGLMYLPYTLQLAYGWTTLALLLNSCFVIVLIPLLICMAYLYGPEGAAAVWAALNAGYVVLGVQLTHRRLLVGEQRSWYIRDVGVPALAALSLSCAAKLIMPQDLSVPLTAAWLASVWGLCSLASSMTAPHIRDWLTSEIFGGPRLRNLVRCMRMPFGSGRKS